jgi:MFS family permease
VNRRHSFISPLRRNLRLCNIEGLYATPIVYLLQPGNFVIAALLPGLFKIPPEMYGLIASLPFWGNFAQAFLMPFVDRLFAAKTASLIFCSLQVVCWGALAVMLPHLPLNDPAESGRWFLLIFACSAAITAVTGVVWTSWVQEWVPWRIRGKYFGMRNRLMQVALIAFLFLVGGLIDPTAVGSVHVFQWLLFGAVALRIVSVYLQHRTRTTSPIVHTDRRAPWREQLTALVRAPGYLWFIGFGAVWGFAAYFFGPFYYVFMYEEIDLTVKNVSHLVILTCIGGALSFPAWGALADRFGNKPVMLFCMIAWQLQNFLWCFLDSANRNLLYPMWAFGGVVSAGFTLGLFNMQLKLIPAEAKTLAISVNLAVTSLVTAIAPILGGAVLGHFLARGFDPLELYHGLFLVQPVVALMGCLLLVRVHESAAAPLSSVVGAMRNLRTLGAVMGLGFLVNFVFVRPPRKR